MAIEICTVGGYNEVGKNMTVVMVDDEGIVLDMGFFLQRLVDFEESGGSKAQVSADELIKIGAIPDDSVIEDWRKQIKAILIGHAHLDHYGAVPYLSNRYNAPIIGTPFTIEVLKRMLKDDDLKIKNDLKVLNPNSKLRISKNIEIEVLNITHSTLQTAMIAIHTKYGVILYANDFKFDKHPILGKGPNYERLEELSGKVIALIVDSLYASAEMKTPSEKVAREMLEDVLLGTENRGNAIIVTCFASHLARLSSIIDFGKRLNRKIIFLGRSLSKYVSSAEKVKLVDFSKKVEIIAYANKIKRRLERIEKDGRGDYLIVVTGGQGEPTSVLSKMLGGILPFDFLPEDSVVLSNKVIPVEPNISNRKKMEEKLRKRRVRIFTDIHVSGHCAREDLRDLINLIKPVHIIPAHGEMEKLSYLAELAIEMGYKLGRTVHLMNNGEKIFVA